MSVASFHLWIFSADWKCLPAQPGCPGLVPLPFCFASTARLGNYVSDVIRTGRVLVCVTPITVLWHSANIRPISLPHFATVQTGGASLRNSPKKVGEFRAKARLFWSLPPHQWILKIHKALHSGPRNPTTLVHGTLLLTVPSPIFFQSHIHLCIF